MNKNKLNYVIGVSGNICSGKTSLIKSLTNKIDNSVSILWDDYDHLVKLNFDDPKEWVENDCDFNKWKTPQFVKDLESLKKGQPIKLPTTLQLIKPAKIIFVEDPTGRTREAIGKFIDYLIYIDLPPELSIARFYKRELENNQKWDSNKDLVQFLKNYTQRYLEWSRYAFVILERKIKDDADLILDGMKPISTLAEEVIQKLKFLNSPLT